MTSFRQGGFAQIPPIVKNLIIINVLVFLLKNMLESRGVNIDDILALHYITSPHFKWWQLITHMFMHASIAHIFFNMFALWMFGAILENVFGPKKFLMFYLICGLGAAACHLSVLAMQFNSFHSAFMAYQEHPSLASYSQFMASKKLGESAFQQILAAWQQNPDCSDCVQVTTRLINEKYMIMINEATVGASGAVFGLLFAFGYLFPNTQLMLLFPPIPIKAKWFVTGYAALELIMGVQNSSGDNIAHFAHLGGMLFAFILLRIWNTHRSKW